MVKSKHVLCGVKILLCVLVARHSVAMTGEASVPLHLIVDSSELVIIGTVDNIGLLTRTEFLEDSLNRPSIRMMGREGAIYRIKVQDILLDRRKAKQKLSHVVVYAPNVLTGVREDEEKLVFLKQPHIDAGIVQRHKLRSNDTYEFAFFRVPLKTLQLNSKHISSKCPKLIKLLDKNRKYAEATKVFCDVMKIQSDGRLQLLKSLLDNPLLRESALAEIERIEDPIAYEWNYKTWRGVFECLD